MSICMCSYFCVYICMFHKALWNYSRAFIYNFLNHKKWFGKGNNDENIIIAIAITRYRNHIIIDEIIFNDFHQCLFWRVYRCHNTAILYVDVLKKWIIWKNNTWLSCDNILVSVNSHYLVIRILNSVLGLFSYILNVKNTQGVMPYLSLLYSCRSTKCSRPLSPAHFQLCV